MKPVYKNFFENQSTVQFNHRVLVRPYALACSELVLFCRRGSPRSAPWLACGLLLAPPNYRPAPAWPSTPYLLLL